MRKIRQKAYEWMVILGISILVSVPLLARGIYRGHDIGFHLLRIEGIADELRRRQIPVRMQSLWLDGYGYPVSIYYGDIFLYVPAILRLLGASVTTVYKVYVFLINMATTTVAYFCFEKIWNDRLIAAVVYCVKDEQGKEYIAGTGSNNRLRFELPVGYTGKIYIDFRTPWYWRMAEMISVVWFIFLLFRTIHNIFYQTGENSRYEEKSLI